MPQQLNFLAEAALRGPKGRAPPPTSGPFLTRRSAPSQESLFTFQAVGHEVVVVPNNAVPPPSPPEISPSSPTAVESESTFRHVKTTSSGEKAKARDILAAIRALWALEGAQRAPTFEERHILTRFPGFGCVALGLFPDPVKGTYKDAGWQRLGEELQALLSPEQYASAKRTVFTAFSTSPVVIQAMHEALKHLGVPANATVLEPGWGIGNFIAHAPQGMQFIAIELDDISGRIARALYRAPDHFIRIENFRDTRLPDNRIDAVIGNVPFADIKHDYGGERLSLHDFFLAKSLDALKAGGVLALVVTHYTLDKQDAGLREHVAHQADFLGAIRLPSDAFTQEDTRVVTDILFLRKRAMGDPERHVDPAWLATAPLPIEGVDVPINLYFQHHPEMVLGTWTRQDRLYGSEVGYSLTANGALAVQLQDAVARLPEGVFTCANAPASSAAVEKPARFIPPSEQHITEGSFFVAKDLTIMQVQGGEAVPVTHGDKPLKADGSMMGRRLQYLIRLRDDARCVLQSQNESWPKEHRQHVRASLNRVYDGFVEKYGPINKTTIATKDDGTTIRRMPNLISVEPNKGT